jgi:GDP-4-dehydro-6-deoxy-D-mannose reductase
VRESEKVLVTGGSGFVARAYAEEARRLGHDVHLAGRSSDENNPNEHRVQMSDPDSVAELLDTVRPDVIVNGAAVLGRNPGDRLELNPLFTENLLKGVHSLELNLSRIVIIGSSAEGGLVEPHQLPMKEDIPSDAHSPYGKSKQEEIELALKMADEHDMPVVVARLFNQLGTGLHPSNLVSRVIDQLKAYERGEVSSIEVRNLDPLRDYLNVKDTAEILGMLAHSEQLPHRVYNVASGEPLTNEEVIRTMLHVYGQPDIPVIGTNSEKEPLVGSAHGDPSRIQELGWKQKYPLDVTIREMFAESGLKPNLHDAA